MSTRYLQVWLILGLLFLFYYFGFELSDIKTLWYRLGDQISDLFPIGVLGYGG